jgi:hypothetical protein
MSKEEKIEEMSAMATGAVEGGVSKREDNEEDKKDLPENYFIDRNEFLQETQLRQVIRKIIKKTKNKVLQERQEANKQESELRSVIRKLIIEAKKDVDESPHSSTAINLLEELLKQILPQLETDYKTLTTNKEQRSSLETEDVNKQGGDPEFIGGGELEEEVDIKVDDDLPDEKFIDIEDKPDPEPEEEGPSFEIAGQNKTGMAMAQDAFTGIEKNIVDTYAILHDEQDEKLFKDYLITNLKMYFDKYEEELGAVIEPTTPEYEEEKAQNDSDVDIEEPLNL